MNKDFSLKNWLICFGIFACAGVGTFVSPIVQTMANAYPDVPMTTIRGITTIPSLMSFTCSLFIASMLGKQIPYKAAMIFGTALCAIGGVLPAFWNQTFTQIIIARVIYGIGFSVFGARNAIISKVFGSKNAAAWMGYGAFMVSAVSIVGQLASGIVGDIDWRYSFYLHAVCLVALVIILFLFEEPEKNAVPAAAATAKSEKKEFINPRVLLFFVFTLLSALCCFPFLSSISTFVSERGFGSATQASWASSAYTLGSALISIPFGFLYKKLRRWGINFSFLLVILGYLVALASTNIVMVILAAALCGAGFRTVMLQCSKWSMDASTESNRALSMTLISCATAMGSFVSSYFMVLAKRIASVLPNSGSEVASTFMVGVGVYIIMFIVTAVKDFRPEATKAAEK